MRRVTTAMCRTSRTTRGAAACGEVPCSAGPSPVLPRASGTAAMVCGCASPGGGVEGSTRSRPSRCPTVPSTEALSTSSCLASSTRAMAPAMSRAVWKRSPGALLSARITMASSSGGTSGTCAEGGSKLPFFTASSSASSSSLP